MAAGVFKVTAEDPSSEGRREVWREWPSWVLLGGLWGFSLWAMGRLPARTPIHWNLHGEIDGWGSPLMAALMLPLIATLTYLIILAYDWGRMDFKAARAMSAATTRQIRLLVLLLMAGLQGLILRASLSGGMLRSGWILLVIFLFFIFFGNLMPRLEPNAWAGIRIPPTLENREVWKRTHRLGGHWFMAAGLLGIPISFLPEPYANLLSLLLMLLPVLVAMIYAYWLRHRLDQLVDQDATPPQEPR
ncbi:SdpI family protein [Geothrix sp. PMB-07]|uniref:SdpI family protein n=1 Tax=Geothrix sp. PMB-07 TaxID=3068640 RepID=UPI002741B7FF|nr:SdpI family protein [Geothrix sp. PMB-07]WLT30553.1 SdpI family protein [Geothrix sp. PMB-07]